MSTQNESTDILETVDTITDQEFPSTFINKQVSIFEHSKDEILELLKSKPIPVLKELRSLTFNELAIKLPAFASREMYARRKGDLLAEDIYVIGFSAINAIPDKLLGKCLKPTLDLDSTSLSEKEPDHSDNGDIQSLTELCVRLEEQIQGLTRTVKSQGDRILALETHITVNQLNSLDKSSSKEGSMDRAEGMTSEKSIRAVPESQPGDDQQSEPTPPAQAENTRDLSGEASNKVHPGPKTAPSNLLSNPRQESTDDNTGFRHSSHERKAIQRGNIGHRKAVQLEDISGSSTKEHCISSISQPDSEKHLVYVGRLSPDTTASDLRRHLSRNKRFRCN